jgi:hypothetical protein
MDLYGGRPGRFHIHGTKGTLKDAENLAQLESSIETASNTFVVMIQQLQLQDVVEGDPAVGTNGARPAVPDRAHVEPSPITQSSLHWGSRA